MSEAHPNFLDKRDCPDGCGKFGKLLKGTGHVRGCPCPRCLGGRNRRSGVSRQRRFAKKAGIRQAKHRSQMGNEENFRDPWRWEIKSGAQVGPILTRFVAARDQSEASRPFGDPRPFAMGAEPAETHLPSVVLVDAEDWRRYVAHKGEAACGPEHDRGVR